MTEKRFNIHSDEENESIWISDVEKHKEIEIQHYYGIATVVKELNALHEENQRLEKELKRCKEWINSDKNDYELTLAFIKSKGYSLQDVLEYEKERDLE
jgi:hypothetical protein